MVAANTAIAAALYWFLGARDSRGPSALHDVRVKLVAGLIGNRPCTRWALSSSKYMKVNKRITSYNARITVSVMA